FLRNSNLVQDLTRGSQGLSEDRVLTRNRFRHDVQIHLWQREDLAEGARMLHDPQYTSFWTVTAEALRAPFAPAACEINLADDTLTRQTRSLSFDHLADELMSWTAAKPVISTL